jgi:hypothetical protein
MSDLTKFGENELSLIIYNTEGLYNIRHNITKYDLDSFGLLFTEEQWETFQSDLEGEE